MTVTQAAKVLLRYPQQTRERPNTCYGGNGNVYECACCERALNVGDRKHADDCELAKAVKVIEDAETI